MEARLDVRMHGEDGTWRDETVERLGAVLRLPELEASLTLTEICEDSEVAKAAAELEIG
jgi:hypothetical protein